MSDTVAKYEKLLHGVREVLDKEQREKWAAQEKLKEARADTGQMRTALQALYSWVKAEAEHFGANIPDDDMTAMVEAALATERGE